MSSAIPKPGAYSLAERLKPDLIRRFAELELEFKANGHSNLLETFQALIRKGQPAINMNLTECIRFLTSGRWLNIYEAIQRDTNKTGDALEQAVKERIPKSYAIRSKINTLLQFRHDTHFASLNVGGAGATNYGVCCVIFDLKRWRYSTCFDANFMQHLEDDAEQSVNDKNVLRGLGTIEDIDKLATLKYADAIRQNKQ